MNTHPLQSKEWAEFRREWGNEVLETKYGIVTVHRLPLVDYSLGIFEKGPAPTSDMLNALRFMGKEKGLVFIKLEPSSVKTSEGQAQLDSSGLVHGRRLFTPTTFWIDLTKSEETLMKSFSSKTRYNIRLAERKGVVVKEDNSDKAFEAYLKLTMETAHRQGFYAHTEKYHRLMWKHLKGNIAHLLTATYNSEIISAWILFAYDKFLYYPYGASTDKYKEVMANNLMMWEAIRLGKKLKLDTFDLWGREIGTGFTKFKEGYNPQVVEFLGSWDLVINKPLYYLYRFAEEIRWRLLRLKARL